MILVNAHLSTVTPPSRQTTAKVGNDKDEIRNVKMHLDSVLLLSFEDARQTREERSLSGYFELVDVSDEL